MLIEPNQLKLHPHPHDCPWIQKEVFHCGKQYFGSYETVIQLLIDNGADLSMGDMGQFACIAAEKNSLELLEDIVRFGGNVTFPRKDGGTHCSGHLAVCNGKC
ncbi:hypothetical protein J5N97_004008 [Dioscorea zingiberensis]|uniref:Uncharacterized protein n=1 Tax=Dioscorea zingiberensis TaxID=325984 RepID=A0A9D5HRP7_9LILI|nr:hypothetical protein J5N97_004008 [Dioscorea zingiberensis]